MNKDNPLWIEISKSALLHNLQVFKNLAGDSVKIAPCIKSNAYGHGLVEVGTICAETELVDYGCVTTLAEAKILQEEARFVKPILILGPLLQNERKICVERGVEFFVNTLREIKEANKFALEFNRIAQVHIKVDTGMHRMGFHPEGIKASLEEIKNLPAVKICGFATHFATSDEPENPTFFEKQKSEFAKLLSQVALSGDVLIHTANSAACLIAPETYYDMIRPGISIYGPYPSLTVRSICTEKNIELKQVLSLKTKIGVIKKVLKGQSVGYGCTFTADRDMTIGVLPAGYYDGLDRRMSNKSEFLIQGKRAPIIGRVCMNITMIDISGIENVQIGEEVVIIGGEILSEEIAEICSTIPNEIVTHLRYNIPKKVVD